MERKAICHFYIFASLVSLLLSVCVHGIFAESISEDGSFLLPLGILKEKFIPVPNLDEDAVVQHAGGCSEKNPCHNGGTCAEGGACACRKGTSGALCERVDECQEQTNKCGKGTDVECVFTTDNQGGGSATCQCEDSNKKFDKKLKLCRVPCTSWGCGEFGTCGAQGFCVCEKGVSGDRCEVVDQCQNKEVDCGGEKSGAACTMGSDGKAYCKCNDVLQGFDYDKKVCRGCNCGVGSSGCQMQGGKKVCSCYPPYKQRLDKCERCDCGLEGGNCSFSGAGEKQCDCPLGFTMPRTTGVCTQKCNSTKRCQNGGLCDTVGVCACNQDYAGPWCETPRWCANTPCGQKGDDVECQWDKKSRKGSCVCKKPKTFYRPEDRSCRECDCGPYGQCLVVDGEKACECKSGYAEDSSRCKRCDCGTGSEGCSFRSGGRIVCHCEEGHVQRTVTNWLGEEFNTCSWCDCGDHGRCRFENDKKTCDCDEGYQEIRGECRKCDCGINSWCSFNGYEEKVCHCYEGYSDQNGTCAECDCDPSNMKGLGSTCYFDYGYKTCQCPKGFEPIDGTCEDINECKAFPPACPTGMECINLPGSFGCQCKEGYEPKSTSNSKIYRCKDINECKFSGACFSPDTKCINTEGSFDCVCKEGYYPTAPTGGKYYPSYVTCHAEETQWREATIALGVIMGIAIVSLSLYIACQRSC